ncbi:MAG: hypothetical protein ABW061_19140 [Polyangiaceae bacterium]
MRALAACFTLFLGLGSITALTATMAGCSDTSDAGSGGASGASVTAGAGGGATAGTGGGASDCSFQSSACTTCLGTKCGDDVAACSADSACKKALGALTPCVCGGTDPETCQGTFVTNGGDLARDLAECYTLNDCANSCD